MVQNKSVKRRKNKKRIFYELLLIVIILFFITNIIWLFCVKMKYDHYADHMEKSILPAGVYETYEITWDGYTYKVAKPQYLQFNSGFLMVQTDEKIAVYVDDYGNFVGTGDFAYLILYIWPKIWGKPEFGYVFLSDTGQMLATIRTDSEITIPEYSEEYAIESQLMEEHYEEMQILMEHALEYWNLE